MRVFKLEEETDTKILIFLLKNAEDVYKIKQEIISGSLDCCAVKPSLIVSCFQLIVAANRAVLSEKSGKLTTKCLNTELLYNLSISKNIKQSLNTFGIDEKDNHIVIVIFERNGENKFERQKNKFVGQFCDPEGICELSDIDLIKKTYKIPDKELQVSDLIDSVVSRIAAKDLGAL